MKTFPVTVIDDFFKNPDYIRDLALSVDYPTQSGRWPGRRSELISSIDPVLFHYIGNKIFSILYYNLKKIFNYFLPTDKKEQKKRRN